MPNFSVSDPVEFDPNDPVDALAERLRRAVLEAALEVMSDESYGDTNLQHRVQGTFAGLMVGACCAMIAACEEAGHEELRAMMTQWFPYYFDVARSIAKLAPLPGHPSPSEALIKRIGQVASAVGAQSNEGGADIAGQIVSCLYASPENIERFMREGSELFLDGTIHAETGALTYRAVNGSVLSPSQLRQARGLQQ